MTAPAQPPTGPAHARDRRLRDATRRILILAPSPSQTLDIVGPLEVFSNANVASRLTPPPYRIEVIAAGRTRIIRGESGLAVRAAGTCAETRGPVDTLLVAGGRGARVLTDRSTIEWVSRMARKARRVGSICTGAYILARAGLLRGRRASTQWAWAEELRRLFPEVAVDAEAIWTRDDFVYTSAGITTGMDLALGMVAEDLGRPLALQVARHLVLFLHRSGNQAQFSGPLAEQMAVSGRFRELTDWIREHLDRDLTVNALARRVGMSPRNFCRQFRRETESAPGAFVAEARFQAARRELEQSGLGLKQVAAKCGFGTTETLRRIFVARLRTTPGAYRLRFGGAAMPRMR
jgi:transcriptional regulator GlxA family with amidase domain